MERPVLALKRHEAFHVFFGWTFALRYHTLMGGFAFDRFCTHQFDVAQHN
jgi:hypothetical protein